MRNFFTLTSFLCVLASHAQFSSGNVMLGSTGMTVKLDTDATTATLTLSGSSTSYLGIGFGSSGMANASDGFIYNSQNRLDYTFGGIGVTPVADVNQHWTILSNNVASGIRTIVATRTLAGGTEDFVFTNKAGVIAISYAKGNTLTLANHGSNRGYSTLTMTSTLSTEDFDKLKIQAFPNPVEETLHFNENNGIKKVQLYDTTGKAVKTAVPDKNNSIDVSTLEKGTYIIEYEFTGGNKHYDKIIKK